VWYIYVCVYMFGEVCVCACICSSVCVYICVYEVCVYVHLETFAGFIDSRRFPGNQLAMSTQDNVSNNGVAPETGLTSIHGRIHCAATEHGEPLSETDNLHLSQFFHDLANVALSVAKRRLADKQVTGKCEL